MRFGGGPDDSSLYFDDRIANIHPAAEHLKGADAKRGHLAPPQTRISKESHHRAVRADLASEQLHLRVREIAALAVLASRCLNLSAWIARQAPVLDGQR
jgi:hypothetical protein